MKSLLKYVQDEFITQNEYPEFKSGDTITVYYEIKEVRNQELSFLRGCNSNQRNRKNKNVYN